jgi:type VI secretion system protein VasD
MPAMLLVLCLSLVGCQLTSSKLTVYAQPAINLDPHNKPLAVMVRAYLLSNKQAFASSTYQQLWQNDTQALGRSLIAKQAWIQQPASHHQIVFKTATHAKYLGVIALFRNPKLGSWRLLKPLGAAYTQALTRHTASISKNQLTWGDHGT